MHLMTIPFAALLLLYTTLAYPLPKSRIVAVESLYPRKYSGDAPYDIPEEKLRAAIKFPADFEPGKKMPILLAPGTAVNGTQTYEGSFYKLMKNSDIYDPIPLDIPDSLLDDIQSNAEYHAYAINYVGAMTNRQVGMVTWSQGSLDMQWALKYWPSTRPVVSDFVAISADLKGTTAFNYGAFFEKIKGVIPLPPALLQQLSSSTLIQTIRAHGGDSAYVDTTTIYSSSDDMISPQEGKDASAFFKDDNGVPAMNYQVQRVCPGQAAGGVFTHKQVLYNSFAVAIAMDAFAHPGPGDAARLDLKKVCGLAIAEGLNENDKAVTENILALAIKNLELDFAAFKIQRNEPEIKDYAMKDRPSEDMWHLRFINRFFMAFVAYLAW